MLGEKKSRHEPTEIRYKLEEIYGGNIDPIAIEYLKITFNQNELVENAEIEFGKTLNWRD